MPDLNVTTVNATNITATKKVTSTVGIQIPTFTNATRPGSTDAGVLIWNSDAGLAQVYSGSAWKELGDDGTVDTWADADNRPTTGLEIGSWGLNIDSGQLEIYNGVNDSNEAQWYTLGEPPIAGTYATLKNVLLPALQSYGHTDDTNIINTITSNGYKVFATATYGGICESMSSQSPITGRGYFDAPYFDTGATIVNTSGFANNTFNGIPWYAMAAYNGSTFYGISINMFRDYSSAAVKDFFYPVEWKNLYCFVINADGTETSDDGGSARTYYSDNSQMGSNGYNNTSRFSADDGVWGFTMQGDVNGDAPGPRLNANSSRSYGCENYHAGDTSGPSQYFYWGQQISSTNYTFYIFTQS